MANLWLIIIGGSILNQLDPFVDDPTSIVDLLGESVPAKGEVKLTAVLNYVGVSILLLSKSLISTNTGWSERP